jgi:hypothetical protein
MAAGAQPVANSGRAALYAADDAGDRCTPHGTCGRRSGIRRLGDDARRTPNDIHGSTCPLLLHFGNRDEYPTSALSMFGADA